MCVSPWQKAASCEETFIGDERISRAWRDWPGRRMFYSWPSAADALERPRMTVGEMFAHNDHASSSSSVSGEDALPTLGRFVVRYQLYAQQQARRPARRSSRATPRLTLQRSGGWHRGCVLPIASRLSMQAFLAAAPVESTCP